MKSPNRIRCALVLAFFLSAGAAGAAAEPGQAKAPPSKAERRAAQQQRKSAGQANRKSAQSGPNARAGTPRPSSGPEAAPPPAVSSERGSQSGANARAGTPRPGTLPAAPPALASEPPLAPQPGGASGANARAGSGSQPLVNAPAQRTQQIPAALPVGWEQQLRQMSPEERDRFLQNNAHFRNLPADEQQKLKKRLEDYDKLSPGAKRNMINNAAALAAMTPEQRHNVSTNIIPQLRAMPADRRQEITQRLKSLNGMSDTERNQRLNDPNFYQGLSPQEHDVLKQLGEYRLVPGSGAGGH